MRLILTFIFILNGFTIFGYCPNNLTPQESLDRLLKGNERFSKDLLTHPDRQKDRREASVEGQCPFAVVLGCADSRIPPEIVFDEGIGDIFTVRVAGNVVGPIELESIEFSVVVFKSNVIMVLGHENCGAVKAVMTNQTADIKNIAALIQPSVEPLKGKSLQEGVKANVLNMVKKLKENPLLQKYINEGKLLIVGGYYNLGSGKVEILTQEKTDNQKLEIEKKALEPVLKD